jgi:hypothetical protein
VRTKVKRVSPETALMRILDALAQEAIEASDEEVMEAATDLRMDLNTRESAAFAGLTYFARPQLSDFFDIEVSKRLQAPAERIADDRPAGPKDRRRRSKRPQIPTERKPPSGK